MRAHPACLVVALVVSACSDEARKSECECTLDGGIDGAAGRQSEDAELPEIDADNQDNHPDAAAVQCLAPAPRLERAWSSERFDGCLLASVLDYASSDGPRVIASSGDGRVTAFDADTGKVVWNLALPARNGETAHVIATPVIVPGGRLVLTWQDILTDGNDPAASPRTSHRVAVIDLEAGELDPEFPILQLAAEKPDADGTGSVTFNANNALSRSRLIHAPGAGDERGLVYVSFGNARDIQPWHGWLFEIDLERWHDSGAAAAVTSVLLTTPESDCGERGHSGSREMVCGAGIWAPAGPELVEAGDGRFDLLIPTGNGMLDIARRDYAHTIMRVTGPGLSFDDGCDPTACDGWDVLSPSPACMESCKNLFIPRLLPGAAPFAAPGCEGLSFFECYAALDWDLGANAPAVVDVPDGPRTLLLPAKDGGVYLFDYENFGTLYDRIQIVKECGAEGSTCSADWAGMMVTRPEITTVDGSPLAIIATFNFDNKHPAGLVGVRVAVREGKPRLEKVWEAPSFDSQAAARGFRKHPSRVRLLSFEGVEYAVVIDQVGPSKRGELYLVRVSDGVVARKVELDGPGQRFAQPLWLDDRVFVASCVDGNRGPSHLEAWQLRPPCPERDE